MKYFVMTVIAFVIVVIFFDMKDRYNRKKQEKKTKTFVFLRENNAHVRNELRKLGFNVCPCALSYRNDYLYAALDRAIICGFNERSQNLIENARNNGMRVVDCAKNLGVFINELQKLEL